ncbi:MAG: hypothetical protein GKR93_19235 [Gammaproteobacteria bacterium]|nr:hypothetical protein [Gammaproteobacteria bacterium]
MKKPSKLYFEKSKLILSLAFLLSLSACNQSLTMEAKTDVPTPLAVKLPLSIGVHYDENFRNYTYEENSEDRQNWAIKSGTSQVDLFERVLPSMFQDISHIEDISGTLITDVDGVIVPEVEEMQFALPNETKSDLYEVWIKYKVKLLDKNGDLVADWPVTGYGKSSTEFLKSRDKGLQAAINSAFRDAGARFALTFSKIPAVCQSGATGIC